MSWTVSCAYTALSTLAREVVKMGVDVLMYDF